MIPDEELCKLIKQAQENPNSAKALALAIDRLPEIKAYLGERWLVYYDEALPMTMRDVERNIGRFPKMFNLDMEAVNCQDPLEATNVRKRFIQWVLMILRRDCVDVKRQQYKQPTIVSISNRIGGEQGPTIEETIADDLTVTGIDRLLVKERISISKRIRSYIQEDPEQKLRSFHPRGRPDCNCQALSQKIILDNSPSEIKQIAKDLNIPYQTLLTHWKKKCVPLLQEIAKDLGYEP